MNRLWRAALLGTLLLPAPLAAQGWRVLLDARAQATSYRGWRIDSIPVADTVTGAGGGTETPDGYVARCDGGPVCRYWRPGPEQRGAPAILTADATLWGLGVTGLSLHARTRLGADLGAGDPWYGPDRTLELVEGYADLERGRYHFRAGRQVVSGRIGWWGLDGARGWVRSRRLGLEASAYAGWGLARSSNLTVTSDALNPLGDFQTGERQGALGATARWSDPRGSVEGQYHREWSGVDGGVTVERAAVSAEHVIAGPVSATGGALYDVASGLWGSWDLGARYAHGRVSASARVRQYRPLFDLWSVWQAFSPVAYHAADGGIGVRLDPRVALRVTGERYWYDETETSTPLVSVEDAGWRMSYGATWTPRRELTVDGELRREFGVGAYANSVQGSAVWTPRPAWTLRATAGHLERPLEYRYDVSTLDWIGIGADWRAGDRVTLGGALDRWSESRDRPDAAAFSWDQVRLSFRMSWLLLSDADRLPLPPGRPRGTR
jgi:hypothetical protein